MPLFQWYDEARRLVIVKLDATTSEEYQDTVTITDHPVEQGANVVDHARDEPERITVEGLVTNVPHLGNTNEADRYAYSTENEPITVRGMSDPGTQSIELDVPPSPLQLTPSGLIQAGVGALVGLVTGGPSYRATVWDTPERITKSTPAQVFTTTNKENRARIAYEKLLAAQRGRFLITVQAGMREYFGMLIERIAVPRSPDDGTSMRFQIDLRRLRVAKSETVLSPEPAEVRGTPSKNLGSQHAKKDPNGEKKKKAASLLFQGGKGLAGALGL